VGNLFTARAVTGQVRMSNGRTSAFFDVMALAGSVLAHTSWQQHLVLYFCDSERVGYGISGFDLADVPWTRECQDEHGFFLQVIDLAARRHGWDKLHYEPSIDDTLRAYRAMLAAFAPEPADGASMGDWAAPVEPHKIELCTRHGAFRGELECRLCDPWIQPLDAPIVWELISRRLADGRITHRVVQSVSDAVVPDLLALLFAPEELQKRELEKRIEPPLCATVASSLHLSLDADREHVLRNAVA
jgi:hypothetical protein